LPKSVIRCGKGSEDAEWPRSEQHYCGVQLHLILLPGLDGTASLMASVGACLSQRHFTEVIQYPANLVRYDEIADWLKPQLPSDAYVIVAESFSGPLAVIIAAAKPDGLKAVILVASFARSPRRFPAFLAAILYLLPIRSPFLIRLTQGFLVGKWGKNTFPQEFAQIMRSVPRKTLVGRLREVLQVNLAGFLKAVAIPRLLVAASGDALVPVARSNEIGAAGWSVIRLEGPHFLCLARPDEVAFAIEEFLAANG